MPEFMNEILPAHQGFLIVLGFLALAIVIDTVVRGGLR